MVALFIGLVVSSTLYVRAFQVPPLPEGNLLINPWFRSFDDPTASALDGWTDADGLDKYWSSSQKEANPAPDIIISGICDYQPVYCGTSARLSDTPGKTGGLGIPGVHSYLYQVVSADSSKRKLRFFAHWVSHLIDPAEVVIYGGNSSTGPWTQVWVPLHVVVDEVILPPEGCGSTCLWEQTGWLETVLPQGYSHYKIEIHARLANHTYTGFKITGIYFAVLDANSNDPTPTVPSPTATFPPGTITPPPPSVTPTPSQTETVTPTPIPGRENKAYIPVILKPLDR
jgi:hypothetical protein